MIRRPPRSTPLSLHDALPISEGATLSDGIYIFPLIPPGTYKVEIEAQGFRRDVHHDVRQDRSEEHTSELQSRLHLVCRLLLEKKKNVESSLSVTAPPGYRQSS